MEKEKIIIEMTPFLFEDGNTYYFKIVKREYSNDFHDLYVFEKIVNIEKGFFGREKKTETWVQLNSTPELLNVGLDTHDVKSHIKKILRATKAKWQLKDWDGFVGDVPDDVKKSLKRDGKLNSILGG